MKSGHRSSGPVGTLGSEAWLTAVPGLSLIEIAMMEAPGEPDAAPVSSGWVLRRSAITGPVVSQKWGAREHRAVVEQR
jgi:hypothetical protein